MRSRFFLPVFMVLMVVAPVPAGAVPATEPTERNIALIREHFTLAADAHKNVLQLFPDISIEDIDYRLFTWLKSGSYAIVEKDGMVHPDVTATRGDLVRYWMAIMHGRDTLSPVTQTGFNDVSPTDPLAPVVVAASARGFLKGWGKNAKLSEPVTLGEIRKRLGVPVGTQGSSPVSRRVLLREIVAASKISFDAPLPSFAATPVLSISGKDILANGTPVRGIFANWIIESHVSKRTCEREVKKMKSMGITGFSTEVGWDDIEHTEGKFIYPRYLDDCLKVAADQGLWVTLLLSPHYTPDWVFEKHGDIYLYDVNNTRVKKGEYMTFAPTSPAVKDQARWQREATAHYSAMPNILAIFLSNEQAYGREYKLDYSRWAQFAWDEWRTQRSLSLVPMPRNAADPEYLAWQRFRQDALNAYLNTIMEEAVKGRKRFVPLSHKIIFYEATSAFASDYGMHPTPSQLTMDIVGADIYGLTPNVYPAQNAFRKPIVVVETNLPGDWSGQSMFEYLMYQYMNGINVQSIFRWNPGEDLNTMFHMNGTPWKKTDGIVRAAAAISAIRKTIPAAFSTVGIIIPTASLITQSNRYEQHQHQYDDVVREIERRFHENAILLWSDDLDTAQYYRIDAARIDGLRSQLDGLKTIVALPSGTDRAGLDSPAVQEWVGRGGTLYIEGDGNAGAFGLSSLRRGASQRVKKGTVSLCTLGACSAPVKVGRR